MKKTFLAVMSVACVLSLASCGGSGDKDSTNNNNSNSVASNIKIGVILVGDESEGYTKAHMDGIEEARKELGLAENQIIYKKKVEETDDCKTKAQDLVNAGCKLVISNSYGHQTYMAEAAEENKDVQFVASTGDFAAISGLSNLKNSFTRVYESRYVSGVVAGLKLKELIDAKTLTDANKDTDGNYKIGYVGAYKYAEVVSGYTAFYLGAKSVVDNVSMDVQFTNSWFDIDKEAKAAETLVNGGCVIIGQHADSTGAPSKCETLLNSGKVCYSVGYNVDMLDVAPNAALTSATNNWGVYYKYAFETAMKGEQIKTDWAEGYNQNAVAITALGKSCAAGTKEKVEELETKLKAGTFHVFDTSKFTVKGKTVTTNKVDLSYYDFSGTAPTLIYQGETVETVKDGYIDESSFRSAPYFSLEIDGIKHLN